jgi:DNA-binding MarR family transcriptional regulator
MQLVNIMLYICKMKSVNNNVDFENSIGPWLGKTVKILEYYLQERFNKHNLDLTKEQMIVLKRLHDKDGLSQNELAFLTLRNKSSLTRLLSKMEKKNYILRKQSKEDKRINHVYLTGFGEETFKKTKPAIREMIFTMEQNISDSEKQQMIKTLKKIQQNFDSDIESL